MLGFDAVGRLALGQLPTIAGALTTLTATKGDLTLTGTAATLYTTTNLAADKGDLTLAGIASTFAATMATAKGDLTLTGISAVLTASMVVVNGALVLTGQDATFSVTEGVTDGDLTLTGQDSSAATTMVTVKGDLTLFGGDSWLWQSNVKGDLTLTGQDAALTPTVIAVKADLTLTPHEATLFKVGGGGSDRRKPRRTEPLRHIEREIEVVGPDGLPKKVPLLERFAPPPPPPPLVVLPVGKPLPRELTAPLDLPLPALPDMAEIERHAIEARDLQDAMAAIAQIPDPVSEQITRLLEDYRDMQDIARVLAEIE